MNRVVVYFTGFGLLAAAAFAQSGGTTLTMGNRPSFEVSDVHNSPRTAQPILSGPFYGDGRYEVRYASMVDLIHIAFGIDNDQIYGGPNWIEMDRFDVFAKAPVNSTAQARKLMLQSLLSDRFKLVLHNDSKPVAAYKLTASKTPKLQEATSGEGNTGCSFKVESAPPPPPPPSSGGAPAAPQVIQIPVLSYTCHNTTMAAFAEAMPSIPGAAQYFDNKPVVDQTELTGSFDFSLKYTPKVPPGITVTGESIPFPDALEKQLGLKMELSTAPMPVVNVESVNEKPTPNSPDVDKSFPTPPTEFDVAEIKPSAPVPAGGRGGQSPPEIKNGRVIVPGITLKNLIQVAWNINDDDHLINQPKWLDSDRFDLVAKAPPGVALGDLSVQNNRSIPINIEALRPMIQSLLKDRFKLQVHTEQRPLSAYTLVAVKPKMQKSDPNARTRWINGPAPDSKDKNTLGRLVTCQNVTMAQLAEMLPAIAPGYIHDVVIDATGLEGGWNFTISFSPIGALQGGGRGGDGPAPAAAGDSAAEPSGGLSLLDAMQKQIGVKLEMQKRPTTVIVIDHIEQKPTDN